MDDLISRQAAIDAVEKESQVDGAYGYMDTKSIVDLLNDLPSAQPEQKKGKWIYIGLRGRFPACQCSECGKFENADWAMLQGADFCPHCGADMRGGAE